MSSNDSMWLPVSEAAEHFGITTKHMHSKIFHKRKGGCGHWFKKVDGRVYVDVANFQKNVLHDPDLTEKAQALYYEVVVYFRSEFALAGRVAELLNIKQRAALMRIRSFRFAERKTAADMINAFEKILNEKTTHKETA